MELHIFKLAKVKINKTKVILKELRRKNKNRGEKQAPSAYLHFPFDICDVFKIVGKFLVPPEATGGFQVGVV